MIRSNKLKNLNDKNFLLRSLRSKGFGFVEFSGHLESKDDAIVSPALGVSESSRYQNQHCNVGDGLIDLGLSNLFGEQLLLKISKM